MQGAAIEDGDPFRNIKRFSLSLSSSRDLCPPLSLSLSLSLSLPSSSSLSLSVPLVIYRACQIFSLLRFLSWPGTHWVLWDRTWPKNDRLCPTRDGINSPTACVSTDRNATAVARDENCKKGGGMRKRSELKEEEIFGIARVDAGTKGGAG